MGFRVARFETTACRSRLRQRCRLKFFEVIREPELVRGAMSTFLRTLEFLGLSLWLGSDVFLSFVVAPGAFRILASRDQAGDMVGYGLWWMHMIGVVCGIVILLARLLRTRSFGSLVAPAVICVILMIALTGASQHAVSP